MTSVDIVALARTGAAAPPETSTLTALVLARLRADILQGVLRPGVKLKIGPLSKQYGFSATPIREALNQLTSEGFVIRLDQRGFRVAAIGLDDFNDILEMRCWLEGRALRDAIGHGGQSWEEAVVVAHHHLARTTRSIGADSFTINPEWERLHKRFHMTLLAACPSQTLRRFCDQLYDRNIRYRYLAGPLSYPTREIASEHEALVRTITDRDADRAVENLTRHYRTTGEFLMRSFDRGAPGAAPPKDRAPSPDRA